MPILRLSAQEIRGFVLDDDPQRAMEIATAGRAAFAALVRRAMSEYKLEPVVCEPGYTNITPAYWRSNRSEYVVEVLPDGESALYHVMPKQGYESVIYTADQGAVMAQGQSTTRTIRLPEEAAMIPIIGPVTEDARLRVHEIIMHHSPTR